MSPTPNGRTDRTEALTMLRKAQKDMSKARRLVEGKPTKRARMQAFRLLSSVSATCEVLKIAVDPW